MATTATNGLVALFNLASGGSVVYTGATEQYSGTPGASAPTWTTALQIAMIALFNAAGAAIVAAVAALGTANSATYALGPTPAAVALLATALADFKLIATTATNGLVAIFNNQTFTAGTCQLSGTPGSSVTPSQAVQEALIAILNTYGTAIVAANVAIAAVAATQASLTTDIASTVSTTATAATDAATAKTATALVITDLTAAIIGTNDLVLSIDLVKAPTYSVIEIAMLRMLKALAGSSYVSP
jgi:hypothetical protein